MSMNLRLTTTERDLIVRALGILESDYRTVSACAISPVLARNFEEDAREINYLKGQVQRLLETLTAEQLRVSALNLMHAGQKIEAIKLMRANTAMGLKEAKDYVEKIEKEAKEVERHDDAEIKTEVLRMLNSATAGKRIEAIQYVRRNTGLGLVESKRYVEDIEREAQP